MDMLTEQKLNKINDKLENMEYTLERVEKMIKDTQRISDIDVEIQRRKDELINLNNEINNAYAELKSFKKELYGIKKEKSEAIIEHLSKSIENYKNEELDGKPIYNSDKTIEFLEEQLHDKNLSESLAEYGLDPDSYYNFVASILRQKQREREMQIEKAREIERAKDMQKGRTL